MSPPPRRPTASVIHKVYEFYLLFYKHSEAFPKKDRFTLGVKIEESLLTILELLLLGQTKEKLSKLLILKKADLKLKMVKLFIRMAYEVKAIDQRKYIELEGALLEIGKMIGGWIKSLNTKEPGGSL